MKFIMKFIRKIRNPKNTESSLREDVSRTIERGRSLSDGRCFTGAFLVFVGFIGTMLLLSVLDIAASFWAWAFCGELVGHGLRNSRRNARSRRERPYYPKKRWSLSSELQPCAHH